MEQGFDVLLDLLSWTPLAGLIRGYRMEQLNQKTAELRISAKIDSVLDRILKQHSDLLS